LNILKVLLIHNFYGSSAPSGENSVFLAEADLLRRHGHDVIQFVRHSDSIRAQGLRGAIRGGASVPWNPFMKRRVNELISRERPDVMHVHNTFPLISPSVFYAAAGKGTATVLTLHNYRLICPGSILMRGGKVCTECIEKKSVLSSVQYGCYRESRLATLPLALSVALHRKLGTWQKRVDAFITLTAFQKDMVIRAGLPGEKVFVKPNFYPDPPAPVPWQERKNKAVFIGRLSSEKGVAFLVRAWKAWGSSAPMLEVIGDGPERTALEKESNGAQIRFLGQLPFDKTQERIATSRMLVVPSVCFEGFPMVIREAFALGVPVAASRIGSLPSIVDEGTNGVLFEPADPESLLNTIKRSWLDEGLESIGVAARAKFEREYTSESNYRSLMHIYEMAMTRRKAGR
jgi:glycosyltransferase involved in cell wall biosynthesis